MNKIWLLILSLFICQLAGAIGAIFTTPSIPVWYAGLNKPFFQPPGWLFAPVWTMLYLLMGIALYLVWSKGLGHAGVKTALTVFMLQLVLNTLWSVLFFGLNNPLIALVEIAVLWLAILMTIKKFQPISKTAGLILIPYLLWVSFASILNLFIVVLN